MKLRARMQLAMLLLAGVLAARASAQTFNEIPEHVEHAPVNSTCPVTIEEEVDPRFVLEFEGEQIGFCCKKCLNKFRRDPQSYAASLTGLKSSQDGGQEGSAHSHPSDAKPGHDEADAHEEPEPGSLSGSPEHDHDDHGGGEPRLLAWLGNLHPPATHLPVGLLLGAALAELLAAKTGRASLRSAAGFCVVVGAIGAVAAVTLGWFNGGMVLVDDDWVQTTHRWLGSSTAVLGLVCLGLLIRASRAPDDRGRRTAFKVALFAAAALVGVTGFFGGALVYGLDHYAW